MRKCEYLGDTGICEKLSDSEVKQPCVEGPCEFDTNGAIELKNFGTVEKLIEMFEKHDQVEFELFGVGNSVFRAKYFENAIEEIKAWNTRTASPRFTEGEREAIKNIMDNAVEGANSEYLRNKKHLGNDMAKSILQTASDNLITVRKMLEGKAE